MSRFGGYWIFFVIVAVGLALSWGQVGRKTQRVFEQDPVVFLSTESPCRPRSDPCAAVAGDRAIVLGPAGSGLGVRQAGLARADIVRVEAVFLAADGSELQTMDLVIDRAKWLAPQVPAAAVLVRIRIVGNRETSVAEFAL